jgi:hypothetical protein
MLKRVLFTLTLILAISTSCYSYTFENYEWGKPVSEVEKLVAAKHKNYIYNKAANVIRYEDVIFKHECSVDLLFTPQSKILAGIMIAWKTNAVGTDLKQILTDKYGKPNKINQFMDKYYWGTYTTGDLILIEYTFSKTELLYYGGKFWLQHQNESKMEAAKEAPRF